MQTELDWLRGLEQQVQRTRDAFNNVTLRQPFVDIRQTISARIIELLEVETGVIRTPADPPLWEAADGHPV